MYGVDRISTREFRIIYVKIILDVHKSQNPPELTIVSYNVPVSRKSLFYGGSQQDRIAIVILSRRKVLHMKCTAGSDDSPLKRLPDAVMAMDCRGDKYFGAGRLILNIVLSFRKNGSNCLKTRAKIESLCELLSNVKNARINVPFILLVSIM